MDSGHCKKRINVEGDRLSSLPDDLIHKILSFIGIKQAIETSGLSSRWRYIWTSMPYLNFSSQDFHTKFVTNVLSGRNNQIEVSSVNLTFNGKISEAFAKRILNIIFNCDLSHNVQLLNITCSPEWRIVSPLSLFSSQSLKHLTLTECAYIHTITTTPAWELPTLTTLNLHSVTFYVNNTTDNKHAGLFSNFANLMNLTLKHCKMAELKGFNICHPRLSNLTLEDGFKGGNVVTPQLKNLTIRQWGGKLMISAPDLASLRYEGFSYPLQLSADLLHLEKVDISISSASSEHKPNAHKVVCLLQQLHSVKFLTFNLEIIKLLSSSVELISHQPSPFVNLKTLKIYPSYVTLYKETQPEVNLCAEVKHYLLDGSPGATFTMVSHEEARAVMNVASARDLMGDLQMLLYQWKEYSETNMALMDSHVENVHDQVKTMASVTSYWQDLVSQLREGHRRSVFTTSMLQKIEGVLTKLPTSHRAKLQARFSGLRAEADTIIDNMMNHLKIKCDKKPSFKCLLFDELATTSQVS